MVRGMMIDPNDDPDDIETELEECRKDNERMEAHITWMQTVSTEQVLKIRELERQLREATRILTGRVS